MNLVPGDLHQRDHVIASFAVNLQHAIQKGITRVNNVITQQHRKAVFSNMALGTQHSMPKAAWVALAGVVDVS